MSKIAGIVLSLLIVGVLASAAVSQPGPPEGPAPGQSPQGETIVVSGNLDPVGGHHDTSVSPGYRAAPITDSLELGKGAWKVTATGAISHPLNPDVTAPNCGLRVGDTTDPDAEVIMIAKQNFLSETDDFAIERSGFSLVGAIEGPVKVDLVCFGTGGTQPFEHVMVAINAKKMEVQ